MPTLPRRFHLQRHHDPTGVSGTGIVAVGVQWPDRTATVRWLGPRPSTLHWECIDDAEGIHRHGGATEIVWHDEEQPAVPVQREQPPDPCTRYLGGHICCDRCGGPLEAHPDGEEPMR